MSTGTVVAGALAVIACAIAGTFAVYIIRDLRSNAGCWHPGEAMPRHGYYDFPADSGLGNIAGDDEAL